MQCIQNKYTHFYKSFGILLKENILIHDVNPSQLSGASHRSSLREALSNARRDTVTHRATSLYSLENNMLKNAPDVVLHKKHNIV